MSTFLKPIVLGLGLVAGLAISAQAQTVAVTPGPSVASLPPADQGPRASSHNFVQGDKPVAVAPSGGDIGPNPGKGWYAKEQQTQAVTPSPQYIGPKPN